MPQKFFTRSIESDFIKQLLRKEPIPIMDSAIKGRTVYEGYSYVYDGNIIKCTKTGVLGGGAEYSVVTPVADSKFCFGNFTSRTTYYDSATHYQLGNYLRYYRDKTGVDLMPFYNCFNYTFITDLYLRKVDGKTSQYGYVKESNDNYKVAAVPVKMGMEYTIFIDCPYEVLVKPLFYNEYGLVEKEGGSYLADTIKILKDSEDTDGKFVLSYPQMSFNNPIKVKIDLTTDYEKGIGEFYAFQRYLYLAIQLPASNNSSIVVLEGDYTGRYFKYFGADAYSANGIMVGGVDVSEEYKTEVINKQNYLMLRQPSLAFCNTGTTFAFSDRLIEYLLLNVITSEEQLDGNISFVQRNIDGNRLKGYFDGVWSPNIRASLWYKYRDSLGIPKSSYNLYNPSNVTKNHGLKTNPVDGSIVANGNREVTGYIYVRGAAYISMNYGASFAFYDSSKGFISGEGKSLSIFRSYPVPNGAYYIRVDNVENTVDGENVLMVLGEYSSNTLPAYEPYYSSDSSFSSSNEMLDMNGYVDKDMEKILTRG